MKLRQTGQNLLPHRECVVLVHGLGRTSLSMKPVQWGLARAGYDVVNMSYPSRDHPIDQLADAFLHRMVAGRMPDGCARVHFVTHSLGGILVRHYLSKHSLAKPGRVVMLAPPNHGSEVVDRLKETAAGRWALGPAGVQLGTGSLDAPKQLGGLECETGIIAGDYSFNPWFSKTIPGPNDGKVSVDSARAEGMKDFLVVPASHTWIMWRKDTLTNTIAFLQNGKFQHVR